MATRNRRRRRKADDPWDVEVSEETGKAVSRVMTSLLGATEKEQRAIEALDRYDETGDESDLDEARELVKDSVDLLKKCQGGLDDLLASCAIPFEWWEAITDEIRRARKYDGRAGIQMDDEYSGIFAPAQWLRLGIKAKDAGTAMLKGLLKRAVHG